MPVVVVPDACMNLLVIMARTPLYVVPKGYSHCMSIPARAKKLIRSSIGIVECTVT